MVHPDFNLLTKPAKINQDLLKTGFVVLGGRLDKVTMWEDPAEFYL